MTKTMFILASICLLSACGQSNDAANETTKSVVPQATSVSDAQEKLREAENVQQPVELGNATVTAGNAPETAYGAMQAAQQGAAANANITAESEAYFSNGM